MKKICLLSAYFGKFPDNIQYFFESVKYNPSIDFICYSDISEEMLGYSLPQNFKIILTSLDEFNKRIEKGLQIEYKLEKVYKICDFRPFFGILFEKELTEYDFWGFHDFDMVFGDIREFISDDILNRHDRIFVNGHLTLYRNDNVINSICLAGSSKQNLQDVISSVETIAYDEMSGMRLAFEERGLKQYINSSIWVDIVESIYHVVNNNRFNKPKQFYMWENGKLWWCIKKGDQIAQQRELVYVHFQKRKMVCDNFEANKPFYVHNKTISYSMPNQDMTSIFDIVKFYVIKISKKISQKLFR